MAVSPQEWAYRWKTSISLVHNLIDAFLEAGGLPNIEHPDEKYYDKFTTGDVLLDDALGGGIPVGMISEVVGERSRSCVRT